VQVVAVDRFDSSTLIAATSNGGLFRSTNGGNDWSGVDDAGLGLRGRTIAFDPVRPGVVYLGTIGRGALKSLDHGVTWTSLNAGMRGTSVLSLRFSPASRHSLYAATDNGAYKLLDGASSWTDISFDLPPYPVSDLLPHPTVDNMAFAATIVGDFVMSDDEHATAWTPWDLTPTRLLAVDPSGAVFHRADIHGALDATLDFGANWYQAAAVSPDGKWLVSIRDGVVDVWDFATGERVRRLVESRYIFRGGTFTADGRFLLLGAPGTIPAHGDRPAEELTGDVNLAIFDGQ
jgi:hypothetical protein